MALAVPILPPLLVYLGLHVVEREVIFVDLALAQVATLGTCVALIMGYDFNDQHGVLDFAGSNLSRCGALQLVAARRETAGPAGSDNRHHVRGAAAAVILLLSRVTGGKGARALVDR